MLRRLLDPQGGDGNGNGDEGEKKAKAKAEPPDMAALVESVLKKHGTADNALAKLIDENYALREERRQLKEQKPPDGSVVLSGDQAREWEAYRELGKPSDLRKARDQASQDAAKRLELERKDTLREVQDLHGYRASVLAPLVEKLDVRVVDGKDKGGKAVREARVFASGEDGTEASWSLTEVIEKDFAEFVPALLPEHRPVPGSPPHRQPQPPPPADGRRLIGDGVDRAVQQLRGGRMRYTPL
jgi:hypothetical protein